MAAPTPSYVQLVNDSGNTGKKARTQSRQVGADVVHEHFFVPVSRRSKKGTFYYSPALQSVQAAAQNGTASGFFWLQNPIGSAVSMVLRELAVRFNNNAATAAASSPRLVLVKFTFTGTASGASVTPAKRKASDDNPLGFLRTDPAGMSISLGATIASLLVPVVMTAAGDFASGQQVWPASKDPLEDDGLELAPGEGLVLYQPDAGTATDPRRFVANLTVEEAE